MLKSILDRLTDNYRKDSGSNVYKLMNIVSDELSEIKETFKTIEQWRDIDKAEGDVLDMIGSNVLQYRGQVTDDVYRVLIKSKIARNRSDGTLNYIIDILSVALDVPPSEIRISENYPAKISVLEIPIEKLNEIGMTSTQLGRVVAKLIAAGIGLDSIEFFGTFEIGDTLITDLETGFGDIEMTVGGTLGAVYSPESDPEFPV